VAVDNTLHFLLECIRASLLGFLASILGMKSAGSFVHRFAKGRHVTLASLGVPKVDLVE
jgi:hypothetical protein